MQTILIVVGVPGIEEVDAVVSSLGGSVQGPEVDGQGNINLIEASWVTCNYFTGCPWVPFFAWRL